MADLQIKRELTDLSSDEPRASMPKAIAFVTAFMLLYIVSIFVFRDSPILRTEISDISFSAISIIVACIWFYAAYQSKGNSRARTAWTLLALAQVSITLGDVVWAVWDLYLLQSPFPSLADAFYLMAYPLFIAGAMFFPFKKMNSQERNTLLIDTGIIVLSASLIFWIFVIVPVANSGTDGSEIGDVATFALAFAYSIMDLLLLFMLLTFLFRQAVSINRAALLLLFLGGVAGILYDLAYFFMSLNGRHVPGSAIGLIGLSGYSLFFLSGISYLDKRKINLTEPFAGSQHQSYQHTWLFYMPYLSAGIAYLLLIWSYHELQMLPFAILPEISVGAIVVLAFIRQVIAYKENDLLYAKAKQDLSERILAENALKESEQRLASIIDFLPDAIAVMDNEKTVIAWNRAMEEMTGVSKRDMIGRGDYIYTVPFYGERRRHLLDLLDADDEDLASQYQCIQRKVDALYAETYVPSLNGGKGAYVWAIGAPILDGQGNRIGVLESIRDITQRKKAERTLQEQLNFIQQLMDATPSPIFCKDTRGIYLGCNKAFQAIFGLAKDKIVGHTVYDIYPKDLADTFYEAESRLFQNPGTQAYETTLTLADRSQRNFVFNKATYFDTEGKLSGLVGVVLDITERKQMEDALRESERRLTDIIDFLPDSTFVIDKEGKVIAWNHAIENLTGVMAGDILGKGDYEYSLAFYGQRRPVLIDLVLRPNEEIEASYSAIKRDDSTLIAEEYIPMLGCGKVCLWCVASALYNSKGEIVGAIESIRDITERKRFEEALEESLHEKEVLIKEVHHRVKNNLQIVSSLLRIQTKDFLNEEALSAFEDCQSRIKSMALVHERLYRSGDLSKVPINEYISKLTSDLVRSFGAERKVRVYVDLKNVSLEINKAIPFGLILNELITNCLRHAFPGDRKGEIHVELAICGNRLELTVSDNGIGMPDSVDIYKPKSTGMALIQALVKQLKGTLHVEVNSGTKFKICIDV